MQPPTINHPHTAPRHRMMVFHDNPTSSFPLEMIVPISISAMLSTGSVVVVFHLQENCNAEKMIVSPFNARNTKAIVKTSLPPVGLSSFRRRGLFNSSGCREARQASLQDNRNRLRNRHHGTRQHATEGIVSSSCIPFKQ